MTVSPLTIAGAAARIVGSGLPVLILDTCIILDVVRGPFRNNVPNEAIRCAIRLVEATDLVEVVVASIIPREISDNLANVSTELRRHCRQLIKHASDADAACAAIGKQRPSALSRTSYEDLIARLPQLAEQVVSRAIVLETEDDIELRAHRRTMNRRPPSSRNEQGKDCQIFEEILELARRLRVGNHAEKLVFCTSNTRDYCEEQVAPSPEIAKDLDLLDIAFTTNLPWACAELGI